jgi:GAF domain-containing protein
VFDTVLENATRLCEAHFGILYRFEDDAFRAIALRGAPPAFAKFQQSGPIRPTPVSGLGRIVSTRRPVHITDAMAQQHYIDGDPYVVTAVKLSGSRTLIFVPMLKDDEPIGSIAIYRREVRPFTEKQIALLQSFAAQAVIAIENARLLNELRESLGRQTATSEVLSVISSSPGELEPVFRAMLANATKLCGASYGAMWLREEVGFRAAAMHGALPAAFLEQWRAGTAVRLDPENPASRAITTRQPVHVDDLREDQAYLGGNPLVVAGVEVAGIRTMVAIPMFKDNEPVGVISIYRREVKLFTKKQIDLVENFAAQAVIAIENARLLNELRQSLQQQTATADVLKTISRSTFDLQTVLDTLVQSAARLCRADRSGIRLAKGGLYYNVASHGYSPEHKASMERETFKVDRSSVVGRVVLDAKSVHLIDSQADPNPELVNRSRSGNIRTLLGVPLQREGIPIGVLLLHRTIVQPFTDKEISLAETFADQAVIAIENVRLFEAEQQRTRELTESLEQQTATSEVLRVISSSQGELEPVFQAMLANATRICEAEYGMLWRTEGEGFRPVALHGVPPALAEMRQREQVFHLGPEIPLGRIAQTKRLEHIADATKELAYVNGLQPFREFVDVFGARTFVLVPMLKDTALVGVIAIYRKEVRPFTDKQIELVKNFAAQAVIAIENTRLLSELRESLQQQTATSEVLSVISSSPANIQPVLDIIGERAEKLCEAETSVVTIVEGELIRLASIHGLTEAGVEAVRRVFPMRLTDETITARAIRTRSVCHVADVLSDPLHPKVGARVSGYRGSLAVPMVRDEQVVGAIFVARKQPGLFSDTQVQLLKTFADQAVIAIENVRLFNETKNSLEQQTATADVLKVISRSTFDLRSVLQTLVESAARFCAADNATVIREKDGLFYTAEAYGYSRGFLDYIRNTPTKAERGSASGRALVEGRVIHIPDVKADPEYTFVEASRLGDFRTALCVPMLREGVPIGVLTLTRSEVKPFTDKQIELVTTFADQAAIAIENVRLFDEIQDKSRQLEEASQHKSQFLANMSHELRTPLNAILGYTELMADGAYGEPSEKMLGILKRLEANGKHLLGLINDVLDLSKIEAGQLVLELSDYCVQDIAQTVRSTLEPLAADKKLAFKLELAPGLPPGHGDGRRLTQVLINLVGNAIKFTDAGEVAIKAEANNGSFQVSVRDTGPGISAADQTRLFQEFQQADNAITRKKGGTGLGLAISKRIIEMHGGRIWVESRPGHGSTFAFTLPVIVERQVEAA